MILRIEYIHEKERSHRGGKQDISFKKAKQQKEDPIHRNRKTELIVPLTGTKKTKTET